MTAAVKTLAVIGVGLIGGSYALALKRAGLVQRVLGIGRSRRSIDAALALGVVDHGGTDFSAVADADVVMLAMPVGQMPAVMQAIDPYVAPHCVLTDAGSTKQDVVACVEQHLRRCLPQFVPGHPIAGAEQSGVEAARADLFEGRDVILTPLPQTQSAASARIAALWRACGARVSELTPQRHDEVFSAVSHLPHLVAYAMVDMLARRDNGAQLLSFAGAGFRDFTRIASSSPEMWRDISLANRAALSRDLADLQVHLATLQTLLHNADGAAIERIFERARSARQEWLKQKGYAQE